MSLLLLLLIFKITITVFAVVIPYLKHEPQGLAKEHGLEGNSSLVFRLYGVAITALLVNYCFGAYQLVGGTFPQAAIWVGIVSNIGASIVLFSEKNRAESQASIASSKAIITFGLIGFGLIFAVVFPSEMTQNLM